MQSYTWFYSLANALSLEEEQALAADFEHFLAQWKSHGTPVEGLIKIRYGRFIIVQSNPAEARPSGCSIDSLKKSVGTILDKHGLKVLDASYVYYRSGTEINAVHFRELNQLAADGRLEAETIVFDHSLAQSDDLSKWELPLKQTWLKRYLPKVKQ
ncbi:MAG: hypothetical protein AAF927_11435 [Bacteroidota bacterium]